jgi:acyl dehydratase
VARFGDRFFRVSGSGADGHGLGWSILRRLSQRSGLAVQLAQNGPHTPKETMNRQIHEFLDRIQKLEVAIENEVQHRRAQLQADFDQRKVKFEKEVLAQQRRYKEGVLRYLLTSDWRVLLSVPFIYPVLLPMLLLDLFITVYQWVCFPLYRIPRVPRSDYFLFDRTHLAYLNLIEKINCAYCSYGNGLIAYAREVVGLTEQYWCPIKHARRVVQAHPYYHGFSDYGDAVNYREQLQSLRDQLQKGLAEPVDAVVPAESQIGQAPEAGLDKVSGMKTFETLAELAKCVGQDVATTEWVQITQQQVNQFAEATGDHQWIHVDVERAQQGPFGGPIAHGFLTLSLLPRFFDKTIEVKQKRMGVNYGLNKVRFMAPVLVGSRLRGHLHLLSATPIEDNGLQLAWQVTVECEGRDKPVCAAESLVRLYV